MGPPHFLIHNKKKISMFKSNSYEHKTYAWGCEEGAQAERERIIALLKDSQAEAVWCDAEEECNHAVTCHDIEQWLESVVADIKGENNA